MPRTLDLPINRCRPSEDIVPFSECRNNLSTYIARVRETRRPILITQNGRAASYLVDAELLDNLFDQMELTRDIEIILTHVDAHLSMLEKMSQKYVFDIEHYPTVKTYFEHLKHEFYTEGVNFLKQGVEEGSLRDDINLEIAIRYAFHNNHGVTRSDDFNDFSPEEVFFNTSFTGHGRHRSMSCAPRHEP